MTKLLIPENVKPFFLILYADKNKPSLFGGQKGYPVMAWCRNLPVGIWNSEGTLGGGHIVGWLPIVSLITLNCMSNIVINLYKLRRIQQNHPNLDRLTLRMLYGIVHSLSFWSQLSKFPR